MDEYEYDVDHGIQPPFTPAFIPNPNPLAPFLRGLGTTMLVVWFIWGVWMTVAGAFVIDPAARRARAEKSDANYFDT